MAERARASAPANQPRLRGRFEPAAPVAIPGAPGAGAALPLGHEADAGDTLDEHAQALSPGRHMDMDSDGAERVTRQQRTGSPIAAPLQPFEVTPHAARRDVAPAAPGREGVRAGSPVEPVIEPGRSGDGAGKSPGAAWPLARPGEPAARPGAAQPGATGPGPMQPGPVQRAAGPARAPVAGTPSARGPSTIQPAPTPVEPMASRAALLAEAGHPARDARAVQPSEPAVPTARDQGLLVPAPVRVAPPMSPVFPVAPTARAGAPAAPAVPGATAAPGAVAAPAPAPTIHVTIGRVEVRATAPSTPQRKPRPAPAVMSLDEYLDRNAGGRR